MISETRSADLDAPPSRVWAVLSDFGAISAWAPNVDHSCLMSDQTEGLGTVRRVQAGRVTVTERVTCWETPSELSYAIEGLPLVKSASNTWTVEPRGAGTLVSLTTRVDAGPRPPQRLFARVFARGMARSSKVMIAGLTERLS